MVATKGSPEMLRSFHPAVRAWFEQRFGAPTDAQAAGWPRIVAGRDTLVGAPTGSGKTLAAFLAGIDALLRRAEAGTLPDAQVVYVSPLKALSNDIHRNLQVPLQEIRAVAARPGYTCRSAWPCAPATHRSASARHRARPAAHPRHHARVALPAAHRASAAEHAAQRANGHRR